MVLTLLTSTQLFYWRLEVWVTCSNWIIFSIYLLDNGDTRKEENYLFVKDTPHSISDTNDVSVTRCCPLSGPAGLGYDDDDYDDDDDDDDGIHVFF